MRSMRFLFVAPPLTGHTNPMVGVASELQARGHDVAWVAHDAVIGPLLPPGSTIFPAGDDFLIEAPGLLPDRARVRGAASLRFLWERFVRPLALDMTPHVDAALREWKPDVIVADQQTFAGPVAANRHSIPWATSASTSAEFADPLALVPKVAEWIAESRDSLLAELGVPAAQLGSFDPRFSPDLTLLYSTEALTGPLERPGLHCIGPVFSGRPTSPDPDLWDWIGYDAETILISLGTLNTMAGERFVRAAVDAVAGQPYRAVVVAPDGLVDPVPPNVLSRSSVPQVQLLPYLGAVVCHAGHNTVCETLAHGLPLVVAPIRDDQPIVAAQVVAAGAGVRLSFARAKTEEIGLAIDRARSDPSLREGARRIAASFEAAGGARRAADLLTALGDRGQRGHGHGDQAVEADAGDRRRTA